MTLITRTPLAALALVGALWAAPAESQFIRTYDPDVLAAELREEWLAHGNNPLGWVVHVFLQRNGPLARESLDALADSIVEITLWLARSSDPEHRGMVLHGMWTLVGASWASRPGDVAYDGAVERLGRILPQLTDPEWVTAPYIFSTVGDKEGALPHLRDFAISTNPNAHMAVEVLGIYMGEPGIEVLREIYVADLVVEPRARRRIEAFARARDWP